MGKPTPPNFVDRAALIEGGNAVKKEMGGLSDLQVLSFLETFYIVEVLESLSINDACYLPLVKHLEFLFEGFRLEVLAKPPTLSFDGLTHTSAEESKLDDAIDHWKTALNDGIQAVINNPDRILGGTPTTSVRNSLITALAEHTRASESTIKSSAPTAKAPSHMNEARSTRDNHIKVQGRRVKRSKRASRRPITMTKADSPGGSGLVIQNDPVVSSVAAQARTNWELSNSDDPFGVRVSTKEFGSSELPFELANNGEFDNVRDKILYDSGHRKATAHFEHLPAQIAQPLQPGVDLTPEPVRAHIAANNRRKEAAEAEVQTAKTRELDVDGTQITTTRGLREDFANVNPTYTETVFAAIEAAQLESSPDAVLDKLSPEALRELRAELKAKGKDSPPTNIKEEEYKAESSARCSPDAPTEEDELSTKLWVFPVADNAIEKAQTHYDIMHQIVVQMQRERLELGPEISDYEVISRAHASYVPKDEKESAALARAAKTQKVRALASSVTEELLAAQIKGLALTKVGGLELTQKDIADILERCRQVGGSSSAALDYINAQAQATSATALHVDPFTQASDLHPAGAAATKPAAVDELVATARIGVAENRNNKNNNRHARSHFDDTAARIERDLAAMKTLKNKLGTTPRDFGPEIAEIQLELAALKAHRAAYPGDPADLVPDRVDAPDYVGIAVCSDDYGTPPPEAEAEAEAEATEPQASSSAAAAADKDSDRKLSRTEQRRVARQKAKAMAKGKARA